MIGCLLVLICSSSGAHGQNALSAFFASSTTKITTKMETLCPLTLLATPDYPVAAGQKVSLHCSGPTSANVTWSWHRKENGLWHQVGTGKTLTLSEPEHSGMYRCHSSSHHHSDCGSPTHNVYIVSFHAAEMKTMGISAFTLSLLALMVNICLVFWLLWQRRCDKKSSSNTTIKGFARDGKELKGALPQAENGGHVYVNYSSTNLAYTDLEPASMRGDNTYSILS
ncbi:uncharacterized protein LOC133550015 [Nerophis ophidion]|uniref:uncharacterized protein LOC133550010 n=1 Tax=Nerophis ophidion TaxID=159077 RepID=UPI002ADF3C7D|nr:uncharacterized protein LOC133550010 [Nerophis ophidion]XP_061751989.1 uncharacterized protein LOC133550015 [Nerophis ophidion]